MARLYHLGGRREGQDQVGLQQQRGRGREAGPSGKAGRRGEGAAGEDRELAQHRRPRRRGLSAADGGPGARHGRGRAARHIPGQRLGAGLVADPPRRAGCFEGRTEGARGEPEPVGERLVGRRCRPEVGQGGPVEQGRRQELAEARRLLEQWRQVLEKGRLLELWRGRILEEGGLLGRRRQVGEAGGFEVGREGRQVGEAGRQVLGTEGLVGQRQQTQLGGKQLG
mmetsp:Transcript_65458/g.188611  ORF Transcript_65458/g.188611 Transcript_65458/m.188611 type:complete len:225 (+) Transcript_65458:1100-1774(+)